MQGQVGGGSTSQGLDTAPHCCLGSVSKTPGTCRTGLETPLPPRPAGTCLSVHLSQSPREQPCPDLTQEIHSKKREKTLFRGHCCPQGNPRPLAPACCPHWAPTLNTMLPLGPHGRGLSTALGPGSRGCGAGLPTSLGWVTSPPQL